MIDAAHKRPELTLPAREAAAVQAACARAATILEYGSGGSTVLAAEMPDKVIFSVESDAGWLAKMQAYFAEHRPVSPVYLHLGDIGPTKAWGHPSGEAGFRKWPGYAISV